MIIIRKYFIPEMLSNSQKTSTSYIFRQNLNYGNKELQIIVNKQQYFIFEPKFIFKDNILKI
jgi:hypothetical protein